MLVVIEEPRLHQPLGLWIRCGHRLRTCGIKIAFHLSGPVYEVLLTVHPLINTPAQHSTERLLRERQNARQARMRRERIIGQV